jgi:hypothetical protein
MRLRLPLLLLVKVEHGPPAPLVSCATTAAALLLLLLRLHIAAAAAAAGAAAASHMRTCIAYQLRQPADAQVHVQVGPPRIFQHKVGVLTQQRAQRRLACSSQETTMY